MIFNTFVQTCVFIEVLSDVWVEVTIEGLSNEVFVINVWVDVVIGKLSGKSVDITIDVVSGIGVEVLTDVNADVLIVVMTALLSTP